MKEIIIKTKEEREHDLDDVFFRPHRKKVSEMRYKFYICERCKVVFTDNDEILETYDGRIRCSKVLRPYFSPMRICNNGLMNCDEETFYKFYKFKS